MGQPWEYGYKKLSGEDLRAWKGLSIQERLAISRHNPFRKDRNAMINKLRERGLKHEVISHLSGLCLNMIKIITGRKN